jgi:hypothetical protein
MLDDIDRVYQANGNNLIQAVDQVNREWNILLNEILIKNDENTPNKERYKKIPSTYLHALNGTKKHIKGKKRNPEEHKNNITPSDHPTYGYMREAGIEFLYHGHTDNNDLQIKGINVINLNHKAIKIES